MVDIKIVEVPYSWREFVVSREIGSHENLELIKLIHEPTGIPYTVSVKENVSGGKEVAELRAKAKLEFIHELHGESWINDEI